MNCFPCFSSQKSKKESTSKKDHDVSNVEELQPPTQSVVPETENKESTPPTTTAAAAPADYENNSSIKAFNFRELASATKNFRQECLLGEGSLGKVYKGTIQATGQDVAVKQLDRIAMEGGNEFFVEVGQLSLLQHPNLVSLVGYCADGDQRLLVYEFMPGGSLEDHLHGGKTLDWVTRMKIAYGTAQGLQYLHEKAKPPVIYRDLKSSKVLLDGECNPKLSNIGLDKLVSPADSKMPIQAMDNNGYNAPECVQSGTTNIQTDVYSFGVILLELISGRKAIDTSRPEEEQFLVNWAQPIFKEPKYFSQMTDPSLEKNFPERGLNQVVALAAMCVQEESAARPLISDLGSILGFLSTSSDENSIPADLPPALSAKFQSLSSNSLARHVPEEAKEDEATDNESDDEDDDASSTRSSNADRSLNQQLSKKSADGDDESGDESCHDSSGNEEPESNSEDDEEGSASSSNEKTEKLDDEGSASSSDEKTDKLADGDRNDSIKSVDETGDSSGRKSRKKSGDKIRRKSSSKKKKSKDGNGSSRHRSSSTKKSRQKSNKSSDNDDGNDGDSNDDGEGEGEGGDDSPGGSQPEN